MPADTLSREEIERILASDPFPGDIGPLPWRDLKAELWHISNRQLRALLQYALDEPAHLASAHADGVREGIEMAAVVVTARVAELKRLATETPDRAVRTERLAQAAQASNLATAILHLMPPLALSPPSEPTGGTAIKRVFLSPSETEAAVLRKLVGDETEPAEPVQTDDGWIEWKGHPHPPETMVDIETEMGDRFNSRRVDSWDWSDPLRYRIVKPAEPSAPVAEGDPAHSLYGTARRAAFQATRFALVRRGLLNPEDLTITPAGREALGMKEGEDHGG